jgi:hypothetical protein
MSKYRKAEIAHLIQKETSKSKLKADSDPAKVAELHKLKADLRGAMANMTWEQMETKISEIGAVPGNEKYEKYRSLYREYQQFLMQKHSRPRRP